MPRSTATSLARPRADLTTREIIDMAGGREALEEACELAGGDPQGTEPVDLLLSNLRDPMFIAHSPTELAQRSGINRLQLHDLLGKRDIAIAVFLSRRKHLAAVLDDIGEDSLTEIVLCRNCSGSGRVPLSDEDERDARVLRQSGIDIDGDQPCLDCNGRGKLRKIGDAQSRTQFLKVHGFDKGGQAAGGMTVNNLNVGVGVKVSGGAGDSKQQDPITVRVEKMLGGG